MKSTIIAIVGPSGSGKTLAAELIGKNENIPVICSFTTRPIRDGETDGVDHYYVSAGQMPPREDMLAYTLYGGYHYWTQKNQVPEKGKCVYVIDEKGLIGLINNFQDQYSIIPVLIKRGRDILLEQISQERIERDKERFILPDDYYSYVIENNGTVGELEEKLKLITKIFNYADTNKRITGINCFYTGL